MHAPDTRPSLARPKKHVHPTTMAQKQRAARSERLPAKPAPALFGDDPSGSSAGGDAAWEGAALEAAAWEGSQGEQWRARTMLRKSNAKNCEDRFERASGMVGNRKLGGGQVGGCSRWFFSNLAFTIVRDLNRSLYLQCV